jgi:hypothetical protein
MKRTLCISALTLCCVVLLSYCLAIQHRSIPAPVPGSAISAPLSLADGGAPTPPWPPKPQLVADGGAPTPPWPHLRAVETLVADGGAPTPPWPPKPPKAQLVADGGAPTPPWPKPPVKSQSA